MRKTQKHMVEAIKQAVEKRLDSLSRKMGRRLKGYVYLRRQAWLGGQQEALEAVLDDIEAISNIM